MRGNNDRSTDRLDPPPLAGATRLLIAASYQAEWSVWNSLFKRFAQGGLK